jgi:hippurate hydrolase
MQSPKKKIDAQGATNIVPEKVKLHGTFRAKNEAWRAEVHQAIKTICAEIARKYSVEINEEIEVGYPCLYNDETLTQRVSTYTKQCLGADAIKPLEKRMTSEDFAFFSQQIPICYYRVGTASLDGSNQSNVHTSTFDIDPQSMEIALKTMSYAAINYLKI